MNSFMGKEKIITLKGYYNNLPEPTYPKSEFINKVAIACGVTVTMARNWVLYGMKPKKTEHIKFLSKITGIPEHNLWID